jgi:hypothetical protein
VVIATEEPQYRRLLGQDPPPNFRSQTCVYFAAESAPFDAPILVLDGERDGIVNNFCVPSNVAASYAPFGKVLLSASLVGDPEMNDSDLERAVRKQLLGWFGTQVNDWKHLRTYRIKYALPNQSPSAISAHDRRYSDGSGIYACGDYKETGSINGAMVSGRKAAEAIIAALAG